MNIYTVSFFGHRYIERGIEIENRLDKLLHNLITQKEYVDFLIGRDGEFDILASAAIKRAINNYAYGNTHFTLVFPYMKAEYRDNEKEYLNYYDEVEVYYRSSQAHPKAAIQIRNRYMIDRSDLVVCCVQHNSGGAYLTLKYAEKQGKKIINISDEQ
ncbi:hypothetical protein [Ruminococcus sp. NK3A76]|uniref:hypothetical protein n=1 Tax=Ruminococcus sp. NK3A76 TaxID=877411 RepID=UPI0004908D7D|nr:hypothetical protein [Ruminococcus sp. NK3A76]